MKQNNDDWENVMTEYRQVLITFRELLLEVKREFRLRDSPHS